MKQEFVTKYSGGAHIQEFLPESNSNLIPIQDDHLTQLHNFAKNNPIYYNSYKEKIQGIPCIVYEGDINEYWLNSIKHGSSCQPFYPTWILSAYFMSKFAFEFGYQQLVDIGSGDGRIAFCGRLFGLSPFSIEIDEQLVELQKTISKNVNQDFNPLCADALEFDYVNLNLSKSIFFIGGLPQMGGDVLATSIIEKLKSIPELSNNTGIVFAGTHSKRQLSTNLKNGGWSILIEKQGLTVKETVSLPTIWTFDQKEETPYIYTEFS